MNLYKKLFLTIIFNLSLFTVLIIGIQNSSKKTKVDFLINKTVELPISFVIGISFISGTFLGNLLSLNLSSKK